MKLNIGAGSDIRPKDDGWVNVDIRSLPGIDIVCDTADLDSFEDCTFEHVLANDILEHVDPYVVPDVLSEWFRVLKPGGTLAVRVPNIRRIAARLVSGVLDDATAVWLLYGEQSEKAGGSEYGSHRTGFTEVLLKQALSKAGFEDIEVKPHSQEYNLYGTARRP